MTTPPEIPKASVQAQEAFLYALVSTIAHLDTKHPGFSQQFFMSLSFHFNHVVSLLPAKFKSDYVEARALHDNFLQWFHCHCDNVARIASQEGAEYQTAKVYWQDIYNAIE